MHAVFVFRSKHAALALIHEETWEGLSVMGSHRCSYTDRLWNDSNNSYLKESGQDNDVFQCFFFAIDVELARLYIWEIVDPWATWWVLVWVREDIVKSEEHLSLGAWRIMEVNGT